MQEMENFKKAILEEYPRLNEDSPFKFACHNKISCFNDCCGDINIFLTPYDIVRLKNRLGISSQEFLTKYTISPFDEKSKYPVILLKMQENEGKTCNFVSKEGCTVYEDRPWACRMYPLGMASPGEDSQEVDKEFYFLLKDNICKGHQEDNQYTVRSWIEEQGIIEYNEEGEYFKEITLHHYLEKSKLQPEKMEMFHMVCYNIDKFRDFIFNTTFLQKFDVDSKLAEKMKTDDVELLHFGFNWLRFALFGEKTIEIKQDVRKDKEKEIAEKVKEQGEQRTRLNE